MSWHGNGHASIEACNIQRVKKLPLEINQSNYIIHDDGDLQVWPKIM
jgi:hypothetical protein